MKNAFGCQTAVGCDVEECGLYRYFIPQPRGRAAKVADPQPPKPIRRDDVGKSNLASCNAHARGVDRDAGRAACHDCASLAAMNGSQTADTRQVLAFEHEIAMLSHRPPQHAPRLRHVYYNHHDGGDNRGRAPMKDRPAYVVQWDGAASPTKVVGLEPQGERRLRSTP